MSSKTCTVAAAGWMLLIVASPASGAGTWHVDDDNCPGPGSGTAGDPFCGIQGGIDQSVNGDEVVVAPGTYNETINFNGKAITLRSSDGSDVTIIDATGLNATVVRCVSGEGPDTILQGFTITGGFAGDSKGGGMVVVASSPIVTECVFSQNGVSTNFTAFCAGGGMFIASGSPTITNCQFIENSALGVGQCGAVGGGIYSEGDITVTGCVFYRNTALAAAGMFIGGSATVTNCDFFENQGNAIHVTGVAIVTNSTFAGNLSPNCAAISTLKATLTVVNSTFIGNIATNEGGAICNFRSANTVIANCSFAGNSAGIRGGAMFSNGSALLESTTFMSNCILWENTPDQVFDDQNAATTITYSDVQGGWTGVGGIGNIDVDPLFVDFDVPDNVLGTLDDNLRLSPRSPAIDAGDNTAVPPDTADLDGDNDIGEPTPLDLDGNPRFVDAPLTPDTGNGIPPIVDMGAFEFRPAPIPTVSEWGLVLIGLLIFIAGTVVIRRRGIDLPRPSRRGSVLRAFGAFSVMVASAPIASAQVEVGPQIRIDVAGEMAAANETSIASSNFNPNEIVAAWNDWREPGKIRMGVGVSNDGGATWTDFLVRPPLDFQSDLEVDPMTAYDDRTGTLWVGALAIGPPRVLFLARQNPGGEYVFES